MVKTLWTPNHHAHVVVRQTFATKLEAHGRLECLLLLVITAKGGVYLERDVQQARTGPTVRCPQTFGHAVYFSTVLLTL